jgi:hypothetical protein
MSVHLSLAEILSSLAERIAHHREQEVIHAEREAYHREQRAGHLAELARLEPHFESLRNSAPIAESLTAGGAGAAATVPAPAAPPPSDELPANRKASINAAVRKVIEGLSPDEPFGPRQVTDEVNRRFAAKLGRTVEMAHVSVSLRWLARTGRIFRLQGGRPHQESKYARRRPRR